MSRLTVADVRTAYGHLLSAALEAGVIDHSTQWLLQEGTSYRLKQRGADGTGMSDALGLSHDGLLGSTAKEAHAALRMLRLGMRAAYAARPAAT